MLIFTVSFLTGFDIASDKWRHNVAQENEKIKKHIGNFEN